MPVLHPTVDESSTAPAAPEAREFDRPRLVSCPPGHSLVGADRDRDGRPLILIWLRGAGVIRQRGRAIEAAPGSLCFLPNDAPVWLCDVGPGGAVAIELPLEVDARAHEQVAAAIGGVINAQVGAAALLLGFLHALEQQPLSYRPDYPGWVQTCVCDITQQVLAESMGAGATPAERAILAARDYVLTHLTDVDLTPHRVAHEAAVSLRTLNRLFALHGDTVGGCIRRHRLERCRADLQDPGKADRTIGQIGALWGFPEAAHFSRVFKDAFGSSPRAYRTAALGAARRPRGCDDHVA